MLGEYLTATKGESLTKQERQSQQKQEPRRVLVSLIQSKPQSNGNFQQQADHRRARVLLQSIPSQRTVIAEDHHPSQIVERYFKFHSDVQDGWYPQFFIAEEDNAMSKYSGHRSLSGTARVVEYLGTVKDLEVLTKQGRLTAQALRLPSRGGDGHDSLSGSSWHSKSKVSTTSSNKPSPYKSLYKKSTSSSLGGSSSNLSIGSYASSVSDTDEASKKPKAEKPKFFGTRSKPFTAANSTNTNSIAEPVSSATSAALSSPSKQIKMSTVQVDSGAAILSPLRSPTSPRKGWKDAAPPKMSLTDTDNKSQSNRSRRSVDSTDDGSSSHRSSCRRSIDKLVALSSPVVKKTVTVKDVSPPDEDMMTGNAAAVTKVITTTTTKTTTTLDRSSHSDDILLGDSDDEGNEFSMDEYNEVEIDEDGNEILFEEIEEEIVEEEEMIIEEIVHGQDLRYITILEEEIEEQSSVPQIIAGEEGGGIELTKDDDDSMKQPRSTQLTVATQNDDIEEGLELPYCLTEEEEEELDRYVEHMKETSKATVQSDRNFHLCMAFVLLLLLGGGVAAVVVVAL